MDKRGTRIAMCTPLEEDMTKEKGEPERSIEERAFYSYLAQCMNVVQSDIDHRIASLFRELSLLNETDRAIWKRRSSSLKTVKTVPVPLREDKRLLTAAVKDGQVTDRQEEKKPKTSRKKGTWSYSDRRVNALKHCVKELEALGRRVKDLMAREISEPRCTSKDDIEDPSSEWGQLKSSLSALKNVVYEEDEGQETRPENIRVATGMIPLLKTGLSPRFPVPTVRTAFDGSIEFVWINGESLVTCCVQAEVKDQEIDITKSLPNQELIYRLLPYSPGDRLQEQAVVIVLQCYLGDAYPPRHSPPEQPRCSKTKTSASPKPTVDPLDSKWEALEESVSKLTDVVLSDDSDQEEEDANQEYRPENVKIALALLPVFKETCGSVYPLPTVRTSRDGSVRFTWTNRQTLSAVTCSIRFEQKEYEVDLSKYIAHKDAVFQFFPFSMDNQANKESIGKVLAAFLSDVFSA